MKTRTLKQLVLYNYRYFFAYCVVIVSIAYFLGWRLGSIGPGLAGQEIVTAARHTNIESILRLPLYPLHSLLQWASMQTLGISPWSIRLPSIILAGATAVCLYNLLKRWFGKSTALLSTAVFISADWFLFIARFGTGAIEFSFWLSVALLCFTKLIERKNRWLPALALSIAGLLFVPLGIYAAITLVASLFGFIVFRQRFTETKTWLKITSCTIVIIAFGLFLYITLTVPLFFKNALGVQAVPTFSEYISNLFSNISSAVAILPASNPSINPTGLFIVRYFELIFILFGVIMLWRTRINRLNLIVLILSVVLVLASGLSDGSRGSGVILVPAAIYMTAGIRHLMHRWKRTFPKNPYARVAAYIPLTLLFVLVVSAHYVSYFVVWPSQTSTHMAFSQDFQLLQDELNRPSYLNRNCLVQTDDGNLQKLILASDTTCKPLFPGDSDAPSNVRTLILQPNANTVTFTDNNQTSRALVSTTAENNVRWVVVTTGKL